MACGEVFYDRYIRNVSERIVKKQSHFDEVMKSKKFGGLLFLDHPVYRFNTYRFTYSNDVASRYLQSIW